SLCGILLIAALYTGYQFRLRKIHERNRALENRIAERTQELQEKNEQLRELNQLKDEFLNIAAHDLRNPLNSILCTSKVILDETKNQNYKADEYLADDLELMHRASEHMLILINNLLDIAKIEAGKVELQLENRDIIKLIREQIEEIRTVAKQKEIKIEFKPSYSELLVKIDKEKMWQAVSNLLSNAVKFTDRGGQVQISVFGSQEEIQISVEDSGRGIPNEKIDQVFNKFSDLSRVGTNGERGTGLGMAITKKIIELHGGRIWVESENGKGTRFTFTLHSQENHAS
ncbi:HAMP domain-containing histidine kinase, partial [bacterium]|nr:HAMP domain-containing histidine kinase [bacterium]